MDEAEKNKAMEDGLAIAELQRQAGWKVLKDRINIEIARALDELRRIELEGRGLQDIGAEYVSQIKLIDGLKRVDEIIIDIEARKEEATE